MSIGFHKDKNCKTFIVHANFLMVVHRTKYGFTNKRNLLVLAMKLNIIGSIYEELTEIDDLTQIKCRPVCIAV